MGSRQLCMRDSLGSIRGPSQDSVRTSLGSYNSADGRQTHVRAETETDRSDRKRNADSQTLDQGSGAACQGSSIGG